MFGDQETGALQQGQVQLQAQAEVDGEYSLSKPSLRSALTSSVRAPSSLTGPAPMKPCP